MRCDFGNSTASLFRFACTECDKCAPSRIKYRFIKTRLGPCSIGEVFSIFILFRSWSFGHIVDLQIFKDERSVCVDKFARFFVQEVPSLVAYFAIEPRKLLFDSVPSVTS